MTDSPLSLQLHMRDTLIPSISFVFGEGCSEFAAHAAGSVHGHSDTHEVHFPGSYTRALGPVTADTLARRRPLIRAPDTWTFGPDASCHNDPKQ